MGNDVLFFIFSKSVTSNPFFKDHSFTLPSELVVIIISFLSLGLSIHLHSHTISVCLSFTSELSAIGLLVLFLKSKIIISP